MHAHNGKNCQTNLRSSMFDIVQAQTDDVNDLVTLFDAYRVFYRLESDREGARRFLSDRLSNGDSVIMIARDRLSRDCAGFVQLYPTYSSVRMCRIWLLNDLYVTETNRRHGVGQALIEAAVLYARSSGALALELATEKTNAATQGLYLKPGWSVDD